MPAGNQRCLQLVQAKSLACTRSAHFCLSFGPIRSPTGLWLRRGSLILMASFIVCVFFYFFGLVPICQVAGGRATSGFRTWVRAV